MKIMMKKVLEDLNIYIEKNNDLASVYDLFEHYKLSRVCNHTKSVVEYAMTLGKRHGLSLEKVRTAAMLHDISGIIPNDVRIEFCKLTDIELVKEEFEFPMLSHQKVSRKLAEAVFSIHDLHVLNAIGCHTTLKSNPSKLDLIVFISDKIKWDQDGEPPYRVQMLKALEHSLEAGALCYIDFVLNEGHLKIPHPWLLEAKVFLTDLLASSEKKD